MQNYQSDEIWQLWGWIEIGEFADGYSSAHSQDWYTEVSRVIDCSWKQNISAQWSTTCVFGKAQAHLVWQQAMCAR